MPKRLPSKRWAVTRHMNAIPFEDILPEVASRSFRRRGEVGRTTTSTITKTGLIPAYLIATSLCRKQLTR